MYKIEDYLVTCKDNKDGDKELTDLVLNDIGLLKLLSNKITTGYTIEDMRNWKSSVPGRGNFYLFKSEVKKFIPILEKYIHDKHFNDKFNSLIK